MVELIEHLLLKWWIVWTPMTHHLSNSRSQNLQPAILVYKNRYKYDGAKFRNIYVPWNMVFQFEHKINRLAVLYV